MPVIAKVLYLDKNWQDKIDPVPKISERHLVEMEDFADSLARPKWAEGILPKLICIPALQVSP